MGERAAAEQQHANTAAWRAKRARHAAERFGFEREHDACDNCPGLPNPDQADANQDGEGDACACATPRVTCTNGMAGPYPCPGVDLLSRVPLSTERYQGGAYSHQGWFTEGHNTMLLADELDEQNFRHPTKTYLFDMTDLDDPKPLKTHMWDSMAVEHNVYIKGQRAYFANYTEGLRMLDVSAGPTSLPFVGNLPAFLRDPLQFLGDLSRQYGDVASFRLGRHPAVLLSDAALVDRVIRDPRFERTDTTRRTAAAVAGTGLRSLEGPPHRRHRRLMSPAFHKDRIRRYVDIMAEETYRALDAWPSGEERDLSAVMRQLTLNIVARSLFNTGDLSEARHVDAALRACAAGCCLRPCSRACCHSGYRY